MTAESQTRATQLLSLSDKMPFGKYAGMHIGDLIARDPNYVAWAIKTIGNFNLDEEASVAYRRKKFW